MLRKIDCIMVPVPDLDAAVGFYERVFGLTVNWRDEVSVGMRLPESDAEVVLNTEGISGAHYLVDDVPAAVEQMVTNGCVVVLAPFDVVMGRCAVLTDPFGNRVNVLDMSKGGRQV
jgi:predicted enzyme related to lactoylglutathione lyase